MISKDRFCSILNTLKEHDEFENKLYDLYDRYNLIVPDSNTSTLETIIVELLSLQFGIDIRESVYPTDIEYFCWDKDYGESFKVGDIREADGSTPDISTPEKLYDYLIKTACK